MKTSTLLLPLFTAAALMAQTGTPQPSTSQNPTAQDSARRHRGTNARRQHMLRGLSERLNFTPAQQAQVRAMFRDANAQAKPLRAQLHQERASLNMAIKADSEQQIDQVTQQNANTFAKLQAIHAKTMAKVYSILTPDQKAKFDAMHSRSARGPHAQRNG